jgi:hypothetical protein
MQLTTENTPVVQIFNHARPARAFEHSTALKYIFTLFIQAIIMKKNDNMQQKTRQKMSDCIIYRAHNGRFDTHVGKTRVHLA